MNLIPIEQLQVKINEYMKHYTPIEHLTYFETDFTLGVEWAEQQLKPLFIEFGNWIAEKWIPNGRKECWDSVEVNSGFSSKYLIDSTEELFELFLKEKYEYKS